MTHEVFRNSNDEGVVVLVAFLITLTGSFSFCNLNETFTLNYLEVFSDVIWVFMNFHKLTQIVLLVAAIRPCLSSCPGGISQAPGSCCAANSPTSASILSSDLRTPEVSSYRSGPTVPLCCLAAELCSLFFSLP